MNKATLTIDKSTKIRLAKFGFKNSTWVDILNDLMNHAENCDKFWENRF